MLRAGWAWNGLDWPVLRPQGVVKAAGVMSNGSASSLETFLSHTLRSSRTHPMQSTRNYAVNVVGPLKLAARRIFSSMSDKCSWDSPCVFVVALSFP